MLIEPVSLGEIPERTLGLVEAAAAQDGGVSSIVGAKIGFGFKFEAGRQVPIGPKFKSKPNRGATPPGDSSQFITFHHNFGFTQIAGRPTESATQALTSPPSNSSYKAASLTRGNRRLYLGVESPVSGWKFSYAT